MSAVRALLLDVGNTRVKWGLLDGRKVRRTGNISHEKIRDAGITSITTRLPRRVSHVYASNVAGTSFATRLSGVISVHCNQNIHYVRVERSAYGITTSYRRPRQLGVDRWVAMIGAHAEFKSALCVVDAGTAVTIDAVNRSGEHLGGQIIPGLGLMAGALVTETSDITIGKKTSRSAVDGMSLFTNNTDAAILNGALSAVYGAIGVAVKRMRAEGYRPKIVLTGGDASRILKLGNANILHRPNLVLQGLAFMLQSEL